jgi:hypothetical protein
LSTTPLTLLLNLMESMAAPLHFDCNAGITTTTGGGLTRIVAEVGIPEQLLATGVMVKVTIRGALVVLTKVPPIFPLLVARMPVIVAELSLVQL